MDMDFLRSDQELLEPLPAGRSRRHLFDGVAVMLGMVFAGETGFGSMAFRSHGTTFTPSKCGGHTEDAHPDTLGNGGGDPRCS
jgi:hypothetical protein